MGLETEGESEKQKLTCKDTQRDKYRAFKGDEREKKRERERQETKDN